MAAKQLTLTKMKCEVGVAVTLELVSAPPCSQPGHKIASPRNKEMLEIQVVRAGALDKCDIPTCQTSRHGGQRIIALTTRVPHPRDTTWPVVGTNQYMYLQAKVPGVLALNFERKQDITIS